MSHEIAYNRALAQYVQENRKTVSILMSEYGDPNFLKEWYSHVKNKFYYVWKRIIFQLTTM